jgi:hypothetical protein
VTVLTKYENAANEWVITDRLNALSGNNFSSWSEYQGPVEDRSDQFSLVERYNLANPVFDTVNTSRSDSTFWNDQSDALVGCFLMNGSP